MSILSYNGKIIFGMACDQRLVEEPNDIVKLFHDEVENLSRIAERMNWFVTEMVNNRNGELFID